MKRQLNQILQNVKDVERLLRFAQNAQERRYFIGLNRTMLSRLQAILIAHANYTIPQGNGLFIFGLCRPRHLWQSETQWQIKNCLAFNFLDHS
jgi:hypothetical protein